MTSPGTKVPASRAILFNDGERTAPSKRIGAEIPSYSDLKPIAGPLIALEIGLEKIREKCTHFREWFDTLASQAEAAQGQRWRDDA